MVAAAPVSALRAAVMACTALMSFFVKRRKASLNALGLSMLALMVAHPQNCVSISFTLSVVATLGIIVFFPLVSDWLADWLKPVHASIRDTLSLTLTANLCTIPISAAMFSKVSLIAPVPNCICAPILLVTCTVGCVVLIVSCLFPPLSWVGIVVVHACSHVFCCVVNALASIPYACVAASVSMTSAVAISAVACFVLWLFWPRISMRAACAALATALRYPFVENDRINTHGSTKLPEATAVIVVGVRDDDAIDMADVILRKTRKKSIRFVPRVYQRGLPVALNEKCVTLTDIEHHDARSGK